jgi:hypothetical protein
LPIKSFKHLAILSLLRKGVFIDFYAKNDIMASHSSYWEPPLRNHTKPYSVQELTHQLRPTIVDLIASLAQPEEHRLPKSHRKDVVQAHPWLHPLVSALDQEKKWEEILEKGKVPVQLYGTIGQATIAIDYPLEAVANKLCDGLPASFHFVLKDKMFHWYETRNKQCLI